MSGRLHLGCIARLGRTRQAPEVVDTFGVLDLFGIAELPHSRHDCVGRFVQAEPGDRDVTSGITVSPRVYGNAVLQQPGGLESQAGSLLLRERSALSPHRNVYAGRDSTTPGEHRKKQRPKHRY
jgi:hypothetical protein